MNMLITFIAGEHSHFLKDSQITICGDAEDMRRRFESEIIASPNTRVLKVETYDTVH
jgi:hypothetical protein